MSFDFNNSTPIYMQIIEHIKLQIINGTYKPGQKLPSVRDFSLEMGVNPNTVQKSLSELESSGLIYTERTNGNYVTKNLELIEKFKKETFRSFIDEFYNSMSKLGINKKELVEFLVNDNKE